jgi:hypothetical protein
MGFGEIGFGVARGLLEAIFLPGGAGCSRSLRGVNVFPTAKGRRRCEPALQRGPLLKARRLNDCVAIL